jgi:hypothetical protein
MKLSGVSALVLGAGVVQAQTTATCVTLEGGTGCNPVVSDSNSNTATGTTALNQTTTGNHNTAAGYLSLRLNTSGNYNTASGVGSLRHNTSGSYNTASGSGALSANTSGNLNTASGAYALGSNTNGSNMVAVGTGALYRLNLVAVAPATTVPGNMTAIGYQALFNDTTGTGNNAQGYQAMYSNTTGSNNAAIGEGALFSSTTGVGNNAIGLTALENMTSGNRNTAVGNNAGLYLGSGSYNTYIGWEVSPAVAAPLASENYVTRIGVTYHDPNVTGSPTTYISGIYNVPLSGQAVVVTSTGQIGVASASSERFKTDIAPMPDGSVKLSQLHPVTFKYKTDAKGTTQYGLVAEEVARVYPELVIRDENGRIDGVRYDELAPMLLNEMQNQATKITALERQADRVNDLERQLLEMRAALAALQAKDQLVAQRK